MEKLEIVSYNRGFSMNKNEHALGKQFEFQYL
jgi:hypothetical protein